MNRICNTNDFKLSRIQSAYYNQSSPHEQLSQMRFWEKVLKSHASLTGEVTSLYHQGRIIYQFNPTIELTEDMKVE